MTENRENHRDDVRERALPDLLSFGDDLLSPIERKQIEFVRKTFEPGRVDTVIRKLQHYIGSYWIEASIRNLRRVHGLERVPDLDPKKSYIVVSNHRSFFDLYVITGYFVYRKMPHRIIFPVRSQFFYDKRLGLLVNGVMSFFAMYPPVFRERKRAALNLASLQEVIRLLERGGAFVGLHPEGTRNKTGDPYTLLPAQSGVGRIIQASGATVIPVFINGLGNDIVRQIGSNFTKKGDPVTMVFGEPIDFGDLLKGAPSPRLHKKISEHALEAIKKLGEEEREIRAKLG